MATVVIQLTHLLAPLRKFKHNEGIAEVLAGSSFIKR
jgi:hypothetical protein